METGPRKYPERGIFREVWKAINAVIEQQRRIAPVSGSNLNVERTVNGSVFTVRQTQVEAGSVLNQYRLKEVFNDYIRCRSWNGTDEGTADVYVAKPFRLRRTPFDGQSIVYSSGDSDIHTASYVYSSALQRVSTINGVAETQVVIPGWKTDFDLIYAMEVEESTGLLTAAEDPIILLDINADGRAWARKHIQ